ncbi:MAG: PKD domain-containing protein [Ferruginibacter sp.]
MKHTLLFIILLACFGTADARHVTGGEIIYDYVGPGVTPNTKIYRITMMLFRDNNCASSGAQTCAELPTSVSMGVYSNNNGQLFGGFRDVERNNLLPVSILASPPCMTNPPSFNYSVAYYTFEIELPNNTAGYTVTYQTCCRVNGISNTSDNVGATYTTEIPGTNVLQSGWTDNSPRFQTGISVICYNKPFTLDFSATDPDGDSLTYSICSAFNGGAAQNASYTTPAGPPYSSIPYSSPYSGTSPLGNQATINPQTGIISGIAPDAGKYVVSVCVSSYRNGRYIAVHRKDFIVTVAPCDFSGAQLDPSYISCDGFTFSFFNLNNSPLNQTFYWDFGDGNSSTDPTPTHTYTTAGIYTLKLVINRGGGCSDSTTAPLRVFPGYFPGFTSLAPVCKDKPLQFRDATTANYGHPIVWRWDFGDPSTTADTSILQNPVYTYHDTGTFRVTLVVGSDKGCTGTISKDVRIVDKPVFSVGNDTLICNIDTLQLNAAVSTGGQITWSPNYNINNVNSLTPLVSPDITTTYTAVFVDNTGCTATGSLTVNVVDHVTLDLDGDTTICRTDAITLNPFSNGLHYVWSPAATLSDPGIKNPVATPTAPLTVYTVTANIGKCVSTDQVTIKTVPYPAAYAGKDTLICRGKSVPLLASGGSIYTWTPAAFLTATNIPNPVSQSPIGTVVYIVEVRDVLGCPKPVYDTVIVNVANITADAGPRDTSIVIDQPLQLNATGSTYYSWSPGTWLNNPNISNPVALPLDNIQYVVTATNDIGCFGRDTINVKLFKVKPDLYVPTAFSPNGDGLNDDFKPLALGMKSLDAFRVYNRWGQLIFSTTDIGVGWDGTFGGAEQSPGTYVWYASGTDYKGKKHERKGTVVLIR